MSWNGYHHDDSPDLGLWLSAYSNVEAMRTCLEGNCGAEPRPVVEISCEQLVVQLCDVATAVTRAKQEMVCVAYLHASNTQTADKVVAGDRHPNPGPQPAWGGFISHFCLFISHFCLFNYSFLSYVSGLASKVHHR